MSINVSIASPLRKNTNGKGIILTEANTVLELLQKLSNSYPDLIRTICNEDFSIKPLVTIYLGDEDINHLNGLDTELVESQIVYIIPTIAGG